MRQDLHQELKSYMNEYHITGFQLNRPYTGVSPEGAGSALAEGPFAVPSACDPLPPRRSRTSRAGPAGAGCPRFAPRRSAPVRPREPTSPLEGGGRGDVRRGPVPCAPRPGSSRPVRARESTAGRPRRGLVGRVLRRKRMCVLCV